MHDPMQDQRYETQTRVCTDPIGQSMMNGANFDVTFQYPETRELPAAQ